jgi:hypothetical protein
MRRPEDRTPFPPNAWTEEFLRRLSEEDEPVTGPEAVVSGVPAIEPLPGGVLGVFPAGAGLARRDAPAGRFSRRFEALLAAATYPGTGRDAPYRLQTEAGPLGFAIESRGDWGEAVGHLPEFAPGWVEAMGVLEGMARFPELLALYLEAVGPLALARVGALLAARYTAQR